MSLTPTRSGVFNTKDGSDGYWGTFTVRAYFLNNSVAVQAVYNWNEGVWSGYSNIGLAGGGVIGLYVNGSATPIETLTVPDIGDNVPPPRILDLFFTTDIRNYSTVRVYVYNMYAYGYDGANSGYIYTSPNYIDITLSPKKLTSVTGNLLITTSSNPVLYFVTPSSVPPLIHIKHAGTGTMYINPNAYVDDDASTVQLPVNGAMTLLRRDTVTNFYIGSYFNGSAVAGNTDTGGTTATSPIVLANITSGNKSVSLPNPATFASSYLCICAYTTGSSTTNNLIIVTNTYARETSSSSYRYTTASGPSIGLFLVSDRTKWNIVGIYRGTDTFFDTTTSVYTSLPCVAGIANAAPDAITPTVTPVTDSGAFHIWKTRTITWGNGAVIGNGTNYVVNSRFNRFYYNKDIDYSAFLFVNTKVGSSGTPTIFPVAKYPSEN